MSLRTIRCCCYSHTLRHVRSSEHYLPRLCDRTTRDVWLARGREDIREVAREKAGQILATHKAPSLPTEVQEELLAIIRRAEETCAR